MGERNKIKALQMSFSSHSFRAPLSFTKGSDADPLANTTYQKLNVESLIPCVNVWQSTVDTPFAQCVRIALCAVADFSIGNISCPNTSISEEETLFWCEAQ